MCRNLRAIPGLLIWCLAIVSMFCFTRVNAQHGTPLSTADSVFAAQLVKSYTAQNELFLTGLKAGSTDKKLLKEYESNYKEIFKSVNEQIKEGMMMDVPAISAELNNVLTEIKTKNPVVPQDLQLLLMREDQPNAYTIGDNSIFLNIGLFHYLESEDQVAFVLAHEIAHLVLKHHIKAINYNYEKNKTIATSLKAIGQIDVRRADRALELVQNTLYKGGRMRRDHEIEADSLGYVLLKNTRYKYNALLGALSIIERYEDVRPDGLAIETYKRFFGVPGQPFDDKWLNKEDFSSYNYNAYKEKFNKDSTASHPNSRERIQHLATAFPELKPTDSATVVVISGPFVQLRSIAEDKYLPDMFFKEEYGMVIYMSLFKLQNNANDTLHRSLMAKGFQKMYEARRDYQMNKYLDKIAPKKQTESYIQFLSFMWNLKLDELKNIADYYAKKV